jgi:hypothetical protein
MKRFTFKCFRTLETRRPRVDSFTVLMASQTIAFVHLPHVRARCVMTARDVLYNDLRQYLKDQGVGFPADLAASLGDEFMKHLSSAIFPLSQNL